MSNRFMGLVLGLTASVLGSAAAAAADYPVRPIRLVVPASAGSSADVAARSVAHKLTSALGRSVFVENIVGAGGRLGAAAVARASADGYTLLYGTSITQALYPALASTINYDPLKDFTPLGQTFWFATVLVCNSSVPFTDLPGLIKYAMENPDQLTFANSGIGGGNHFSTELFAKMADIKIRHIPFRGNAPGIHAVVANVVSCTSQTEVKSFVGQGQVRAFATTGKRRDPRFPDLPTVAEAGVAGYETSWWHAVYVPAGTPSVIVEKLAGALQAVMQDSDVRAQLEEIGLVAQYRPAEQVTQQMSSDMASFRRIAKESNISLD
ncbi:tripartite tricarboxylate transporter substrate binding protein [Bradyrhizobium yuanmingense]|uniref:Bug family tripartite tricarboxylate transporter substrate binding protein n=1 Tax=Bradyrhizobium yuanmingense TaxID=108015 RepID=UPI0023B90F85|nr:tripartite tricarboxylate transporter substrate binding protein [Bradyrhizobium yuanmingense]MDF0519100.1 tripartite tricarboxylate transporter substrate binding protein [Bradyrhizobium yuanmingense]